MDERLGDSASLHVAHWNCSCEVVRGSPLLLAPLAAAVAGGWLTALRWFHHLGDERVSLLITQDARHLASECRRVINQFLRFRQWLVEDNGNEHFATIFVDYCGSASLYLGKDCYCFVFTQSAFPFLQSSLRKGVSLRWRFQGSGCP